MISFTGGIVTGRLIGRTAAEDVKRVALELGGKNPNIVFGDAELDAAVSRGDLEEVRKYCPSLTLDDLKPYPAGVRAQAVTRDGKLVDDFLFVNTPRTINVGNAPSPAATSALPIGAHIVAKVREQVDSQR